MARGMCSESHGGDKNGKQLQGVPTANEQIVAETETETETGTAHSHFHCQISSSALSSPLCARRVKRCAMR